MGGQNSIANAVGKGPALILTVDGKDYILAPLLMEDLGDVEIEARRRHRTDVLETVKAAGDLLTSDQRLEMIKELSLESDSWLDFLGTPSGADYILRLRIRKSYPEMSEEQIKSLLTVQAIKDLEQEMLELVGLDVFTGTVESDGDVGMGSTGDAGPPESG